MLHCQFMSAKKYLTLKQAIKKPEINSSVIISILALVFSGISTYYAIQAFNLSKNIQQQADWGRQKEQEKNAYQAYLLGKQLSMLAVSLMPSSTDIPDKFKKQQTRIMLRVKELQGLADKLDIRLELKDYFQTFDQTDKRYVHPARTLDLVSDRILAAHDGKITASYNLARLIWEFAILGACTDSDKEKQEFLDIYRFEVHIIKDSLKQLSQIIRRDLLSELERDELTEDLKDIKEIGRRIMFITGFMDYEVWVDSAEGKLVAYQLDCGDHTTKIIPARTFQLVREEM